MSSTPTPGPEPDVSAPSKDPTVPASTIPLPGFISRVKATLGTNGITQETAREEWGPEASPRTEPTGPRPDGTSPGPGHANFYDDESPAWLQTPTPAVPRRTTSSGGESARIGRKELAAAVSGMLTVLAGFFAWTVSRRGKYELRVPTDHERNKVAEPVARILDRHVGAAFLTADITDGIEAAAGVAAYVSTAPLTRVGGAIDEHPANGLAEMGYDEP